MDCVVFSRLFFELTPGLSREKREVRAAKSLFDKHIYRAGEILGDG